MNTSRSIPIGLALVSGLLLTLTTPNIGLYGLIYLALIPYGVTLFQSSSTRNPYVLMLLMSMPFSFFSIDPLYHLAGSWWREGGSTALLSSKLIYPIGITGIGIVLSLSNLIPLFVFLKSRSRFPAPIFLFSLTWAIMEYLRSSYIFAGYSWSVVGYALYTAKYLKHFASYFSVYGLSFLVVFTSITVAQLIARYIHQRNTPNTPSNTTGIYQIDYILLVGILLGALLLGIQRERVGYPPIGPLRVAVISSTMRTEEGIGKKGFDIYKKLLGEALEAHPSIVVLPENVFPYFITNEETANLSQDQIIPIPDAQKLFSEFIALSRKFPDTTITLPVHTDNKTYRYNSILFYKDGIITGVYHKIHPVPFTEYSPLGLQLHTYESIDKGAPKQEFSLGNIPMTAYLCSEINLGAPKSVNPKIIVIPSNDSVTRTDGLGITQYQHARMRAIESQAYVLRSTKGGESSIIDPYGNVLKSMENTNGVLVWDIK